ncbi:hypothetical protein D3C87_2147780 [compost metagenome]
MNADRHFSSLPFTPELTEFYTRFSRSALIITVKELKAIAVQAIHGARWPLNAAGIANAL